MRCEIKRRGWIIAGLILLLAGAFWIRDRGIEWPLLHPDEYKITRWATWIETHSRTENPAYPGGYFHLVKPLLLLRNVAGRGAAEWAEYQGHRQVATQSDEGRTFFLRKINVFLGVITVLLVFSLARRVSGSGWAGLVAASLLAFSKLHVEHSHYAETDIAMLFALTLALYLWVRVVETRSLMRFGFAALLTGFAIGTKYTNMILLLPAGVGGWVCWGAVTGRASSRAAKLMGLGLVLMLCGWLFTNRHIFDGMYFWHQLHDACQSTYGEREGILGASAADPFAALRSNWNEVRDHLAEIHLGWWLFIILGAGLSCSRAYLRYWPVTLCPIGIYLLYCLKVAPWIRGQECLLFYPFMAVCLAIGVKESWDWARRTRWAGGWAVAMGLLLCLAAGVGLTRSLRFTSLFEVTEPRLAMQRWLYCHAPLQKQVGAEAYTVPTCHLFSKICPVEQVEWLDAERLKAMNMDYLLRNVSSYGRGTVDPRTGELYANYQTNLANFKATAHLLGEWGPRKPTFSFVGNQMEWWDARPFSGNVKLHTPKFRPALMDRSPSVMVPLSESEVGSSQGLFVDSTPRSIMVSGSSVTKRTLYIVLQTQERAGDVIVNGMGDRQVVHMDPYQVKVVSVRRPWYWPRFSEYDEISLYARKQPHIVYLPCYAQAVTDVRDVAFLLYQKGYSDQALAWFEKRPATGEEAWVQFASAVEQKQWALAERIEPMARQTLVEFEKVRACSPDQVLLNGVSGTAYQEHARMRLPLLDNGQEGIRMNLPETLLNVVPGPTGNLFGASVSLPVVLAPGRYIVKGRISEAPPVEPTQAWDLNVGVTCHTGAVAVAIEPGQRSQWSYPLTVRAEQALDLTFSSLERGGQLMLSGVEIQWNGPDLLWAERRELYRALILMAANRGKLDEARQWLESARRSVPDPEGWGLVEAEMLAACGSGVQGGLTFYPWLKLIKADVQATRAELTFEVLKNFMPPLEISVYRKKLGGPQKIHKGPLVAPSRVRGERITFAIPLSKPCPVADLYVKLNAAVEWGAAPLRVEGVRDGRVRLNQLPVSVPILMYHRIGDEVDSPWWVTVSDFEIQLQSLREQGYESVWPSDLVAHQRSGRPLPHKPIILTFDDGYQNLMVHAEPLLKQYGFTGVSYLIAGKIGDSAATRQMWEGSPLLIWPEVRAMQQRGTIRFGGHSLTHPNLRALADSSSEIDSCYRELASKGGLEPEGFCFPFGQYKDETVSSLGRSKFTTATTCADGIAAFKPGTALFELPRVTVMGGWHRFRADVTAGLTNGVTVSIVKEGRELDVTPKLVWGDGSYKWLDSIRVGTVPCTISYEPVEGAGQAAPILELWDNFRVIRHFHCILR